MKKVKLWKQDWKCGWPITEVRECHSADGDILLRIYYKDRPGPSNCIHCGHYTCQCTASIDIKYIVDYLRAKPNGN